MMFDLHCHILPAIDDGAKDEYTSNYMLQMASMNRTEAIVATPHVIETRNMLAWERIISECKRLSELAIQRGLNITIYPGAEVAVNADFLTFLQNPGPYCINGKKYILVELPALQIPNYAEEFFFTLQTRGFGIILAHPERNSELVRKPEILQGWFRKDILIQINSSSLLGESGKRAMQFAEMLVNNGMVHCVGSDAHGINARRPGLIKAADKLNAIVGEKMANQILIHNPQKILAGENILVSDSQNTILKQNSKWGSAFNMLESMLKIRVR